MTTTTTINDDKWRWLNVTYFDDSVTDDISTVGVSTSDISIDDFWSDGYTDCWPFN